MKCKELFLLFFIVICVNQVLTRSILNEGNEKFVSQIGDESKSELKIIRLRRDADESDNDEENDENDNENEEENDEEKDDSDEADEDDFDEVIEQQSIHFNH